MYVLNDICYAGEMQDGIKVTEAKPLRGGMMLVTFSTGEKRQQSCSVSWRDNMERRGNRHSARNGLPG